MAKDKTLYRCQSCGQTASRWSGQCGSCQAWNTLAEEVTASSKSGRSRLIQTPTKNAPTPLDAVQTEGRSRHATSLEELDRVLGGGIVPGSVTLLGGEPGVGKSTLLLQAADDFARRGMKVLYVSGEESLSQIALRAERLGARSPNVLLFSETELESVVRQVEAIDPALLIIDSIQTMQSSVLEMQMGSVGQLRGCSHELIHLAKSREMACFLVGHVTKEGTIAGPKLLEHMVDVVLYFETTSTQNFRMLRSVKNRFGATNEVGVFEIREKGLLSVSNPSAIFLQERSNQVPGSVIVACLEGTRALLVEVQALVSGTSLAMPRRTSMGLDSNRVNLLCAILEKRAGFRLFDQDVYVNIAGGLRLQEPAADLAVAAALISNITAKPVPSTSAFFGEIGLGGEVRSVARAEDRVREIARMGFSQVFLPSRNAEDMSVPDGLQWIAIDHVQQLTDYV